MVSDCNASIGGVDLADVLIALYRTTSANKVNGWLLYCCHCNEQSIPKKNQKPQSAFIVELANGLRLAGKINAQKMKFSIKDFFSKCDQIRRLVTFTEEILNGKLHFLCSEPDVPLTNFNPMFHFYNH